MVVTEDPPAKRRLSKQDWADAALAAIADGGIGAVAIEPIAARLATTKGSFYWHFANREALLEAALAEWERRHTTEVLVGVDAVAGEGPLMQLRALITRVIDDAERDPIGLALLSAASHPGVAKAVERVTETRLAAIAALFVHLGLAPEEARVRALVAYAAYLGHSQLAHSTPGVLPQTKKGRRAYLDHALAVLTAPPRA